MVSGMSRGDYFNLLSLSLGTAVHLFAHTDLYSHLPLFFSSIIFSYESIGMVYK